MHRSTERNKKKRDGDERLRVCATLLCVCPSAVLLSAVPSAVYISGWHVGLYSLSYTLTGTGIKSPPKKRVYFVHHSFISDVWMSINHRSAVCELTIE